MTTPKRYVKTDVLLLLVILLSALGGIFSKEAITYMPIGDSSPLLVYLSAAA